MRERNIPEEILELKDIPFYVERIGKVKYHQREGEAIVCTHRVFQGFTLTSDEPFSQLKETSLRSKLSTAIQTYQSSCQDWVKTGDVVNLVLGNTYTLPVGRHFIESEGLFSVDSLIEEGREIYQCRSFEDGNSILHNKEGFDLLKYLIDIKNESEIGIYESSTDAFSRSKEEVRKTLREIRTKEELETRTLEMLKVFNWKKFQGPFGENSMRKLGKYPEFSRIMIDYFIRDKN